MPFRQQTIQQKILLVLLPVCVAPAIFFIAMMVIGTRATFEENMGREYTKLASNIAAQFDIYLEAQLAQSREAMLGSLFSDDWLERGPQSVKAVAFAQAWEDEPVELKVMPGPRLEVIERVRPAVLSFLNQLAASRQEWSAAEALVDANIPVPGSVGGLPLLIFAQHQPLTGETVFVLMHCGDFTDRFLANPFLPGSLTNFYSNGGFIVRGADAPGSGNRDRVADAMSRLATSSGWDRVDLEDGPYLVGQAASLAMSNRAQNNPGEPVWSVGVLYDMEPYLVAQNRRSWLALVLGLLIVLALMAAAALMAQRIVSPLGLLRRQSEALARGELDAVVAVTTRDEIGELAVAFNAMAANLRGSHRALEERAEINRLYADHINAMNEIAAAIVQSLSLDEIFDILDSQLKKIFDFDAIWIALSDAQGADLRITHIMPAGLITVFDGDRIPQRRSLHGRVVETQESLHAEIGPGNAGQFFEAALHESEGLQSFLIAPLPAHDRILGTMTIASRRPDAYVDRNVGVLTSLARAVAIALEQTDLFRRISQLASELERKVETRTSELQRANSKLIQTEKYFATGRMAGNLAHEINNPLGIIKNYLQLAIVNMQAGTGGARKSDPTLEHLTVIDEEVDRIAKLVRGMLNLHRPVETDIEPIDVNALIDSVLTLMEHGFEKHAIGLVKDYGRNLPRPVASPDLIRQVLINLIRNAQDAIERGGSITIRTAAATMRDGEGEHPAVRVEVADTGCGMTPEQMSQIFDPFYTTKEQDKGTGLGLCVSYSIVQMYRGAIDVDSEPDKGSVFTLTLPVRPLDSEKTGLRWNA